MALERSIRLIGISWLFALAALVAIGMLTGAINTRGLLREKADRRIGGFSPANLQLLLITLASAATYIKGLITSPDPHRLPGIPVVLVAAFGMSNGFHLASRVASAFKARARKSG